MRTTVHLNEYFNKKLTELTELRIENNQPVKTKQGIVEQLIEAAHKRECK